MIPPQAAARFARAKNTEIKKHIIIVAIMKTKRNRKITNGLLCHRIFPPLRTATSSPIVMVIRAELLMNHATQWTPLPRPMTCKETKEYEDRVKRRTFHGTNVILMWKNNTAFSLTWPIEVPGEPVPLSFHKLCVDMHANETKFLKKQFPRVLSHDLYFENKTYKLINNYSLSPNGLWVNSPWGRRPNGLLSQRPWGGEE